MSNILFEVKGLTKNFRLGKKKTADGKKRAVLRAVDTVNFKIIEGEVLGVVGESGSGKSTLGRCLLGLLPASSGEAFYAGEDILKMNQAEIKKRRRAMQMIFQNPRSSFNPKMSIGKSLAGVAKFYGMAPAAKDARIKELFELTNLPDELLSHRSDQLSGGQLQRLAIVRALIPSPKFIVADEPVSALDVSVQAQILNLFADLKEKLNLTILFISHDLTVVEHICDRVLVFYLGAIVEQGKASELFANPMHPYTKSLIAARPKDDPDTKKEYTPLEGEIPSAAELPTGCRFHTRCPAMLAGVCDIEAPPEVEVSPGHIVSCHRAK